ncbi:MAG TPA: hypothetical protein VM899_04510, partial [Rubellimicrobium sp.]|nr:hypothetical protein [Rubellimicrobium sp.]
VLRAFGFRTVVVANGLLAAATVAGFAAVPQGLPEVALWGLLLATGASRSLQLTALNTLAFADVTERQRATSTTLTAMTQQVAQLLGVALSVVAIRAVEAWRGAPESGLPDLRGAFLAMGALGVVSALAFVRLAPGTGREVTGHGG